jgi:hypothetical protein
MKIGNRVFLIVGILLIVGSLIFGGIWLVEKNVTASISNKVQSAAVTGAPRMVTKVGAKDSNSHAPTPTEEVKPTETPGVVGFVLGGQIDMSSKAPVALTLEFPDGKLMSTNWAGAVGFSETDNQKTIFVPGNGIIYTYMSDVLTTWAHSGVMGTQKFFATDYDLFVRKTAEGHILDQSEGEAMAESLKGLRARLCQAPDGKIGYLSDHDPNSVCLGKEIEVELVASAIVPHEMVEEYNTPEVTYTINAWMAENFPGKGFEELDGTNGWLIRYCVGKFADQTLDGTMPGYEYNRGVLGFKILSGE